jgi:hypothetical protein
MALLPWRSGLTTSRYQSRRRTVTPEKKFDFISNQERNVCRARRSPPAGIPLAITDFGVGKAGTPGQMASKKKGP